VLKDEVSAMGLHFVFENVDPETGVLSIGAAQATAEQQKVPIEIAENAARSDYIVLEAIVFPGINLVWAGSLLMMLGLALAMLWRLTARRRA
jgi:cytochrome c-type biogenesis protein CcmF